MHLVHATVSRWVKMALARGYRCWVLAVLEGKAGEAVERRRRQLRDQEANAASTLAQQAAMSQEELRQWKQRMRREKAAALLRSGCMRFVKGALSRGFMAWAHLVKAQLLSEEMAHARQLSADASSELAATRAAAASRLRRMERDHALRTLNLAVSRWAKGTYAKAWRKWSLFVLAAASSAEMSKVMRQAQEQSERSQDQRRQWRDERDALGNELDAARASAAEKLRRLHEERAVRMVSGAVGAWMKRTLSRGFRQWSMVALHGVVSEKMRMLRQREREL